jgi:hypothetical protein
MNKKNKIDKEEKKKIKEEKKKIKAEKKLKKVVNKEKPTKAFIDKEKAYRTQRIKSILELTVVLIMCLFMMLLLCNRTFFRDEYRTSKIAINIPYMMYFKKDDGKEIVMKTLRKSQYVKDFFDGELDKLTRYNCGTNSFYYIDETNTAIYRIDIEKNFAIKTVRIKYTQGEADCLCEAGLNGVDPGNSCVK